MGRQIAEKIDEIIARRKAKIPQIEEREKTICAAIEAVNKVQRLKDRAINSDGTINTGTEFGSILSVNPEAYRALLGFDPTDFLNKGRTLLNDYKTLKERFSRDFINIAVVGPARQGKSKFLQSATGLDDRCIPALDGGHCTGASSVIENGNNETVKAEITFKTESEIIDEIQGYLDVITNKCQRIYSLNQLEQITGEMLNKWMADAYRGKENENSDAIVAITLFTDRYINHRSEWQKFIGTSMKTLTDADEIMLFVSQHNSEKEFLEDEVTPNSKFQKHYGFVAVKLARITIKFGYEECGKIRMIDTVGLGSIENDTEQNMIDTIKQNSDGVILFKRPESAVSGTTDSFDQSIYKRLRKEFSDRKMGKWFAYVLNHTCECEKYHDNMAMCNKVKSEIESFSSLPLMSLDIIDVSSKEAVVDGFLVGYLSRLSNNIDEIDEVFISEAERDAYDTFDEYENLCNKLTRIIAVKGGVENYSVYEERFLKVYKDLCESCININRVYTEKKDEKCEILLERCEQILNKGNIEALIPQEEEVKKYLYGGTGLGDTYGYFLDLARKKLTQDFINIDTDLDLLLIELKNKYAIAFMEAGRLNSVLPCEENEQPYEWLNRFSGKLDSENYKNIVFACKMLNNFVLSVKSFMMYRIRMALYPISRSNIVLTHENFSGGSPEKAVIFYLKKNLLLIKSALEDALRDFYTTPNEALFGLSDQFMDYIKWSEESKSEWNHLYLDKNNWPRIWKEEILQDNQQAIAMDEWTSIWETVQKYDRKDCFSLSKN